MWDGEIVQPDKTKGAEGRGKPDPVAERFYGDNTNDIRLARQDGPPLPDGTVPDVKVVKDNITRDTNNKIKDIDFKAQGFAMHFDRGADGNINHVITTAVNKDGQPVKDAKGNPVKNEYVKENNKWYYLRPNGSKQQMQGDLRLDENGDFTQVLGRYKDANGNIHESARTRTSKGNEILRRPDGSFTTFNYDDNGQKIGWVEKTPDNVTVNLTRDLSKPGQEAWTTDEANPTTFYNPTFARNGNLTYSTDKDLDQKTNQVITSAGDTMTNGENGVRYGFNIRGDVSSISFKDPRLFEGHRVNRIDIAYRDFGDTQSQIIDNLALTNTNQSPYPIKYFSRLKDSKVDPSQALNEWATFDARQVRLRNNLKGDYSITDGLISTTEPLPANAKARETFLTNNPKIGTVVAAYDKDHKDNPATHIVCRYLNSDKTSQTNKLLDDEYEVKVPNVANIADKDLKLNIPVPGEFGYTFPINTPPAPTPDKNLPPPTGSPADKEKSKKDESTEDRVLTQVDLFRKRLVS